MLRGACLVSYRFVPEPGSRIEVWEQLVALDHFRDFLDVKADEIQAKHAEDEEETQPR